jgi:hypothetical protein
MTESLDPLEMELLALRPRDVSRELQGRVAERLHQRAWRYRPAWRAAVVGGLATAAGILLALVLWLENRKTTMDPPVVSIPPQSRGVVEESRPTMQAYNRALAESPEALEALLDKHAGLLAGAGPSTKPVDIFSLAQTIPEWIGIP